MSGCVDHFAREEKEAYACTRNIISTLNFQLPEEEEESRKRKAEEEPLYSAEELLGLAPQNYNYSLDVKMVQMYNDEPLAAKPSQIMLFVWFAEKSASHKSCVTSATECFIINMLMIVSVQVISRLTDGSRFHEFKAGYGTTLITGFAKIHG